MPIHILDDDNNYIYVALICNSMVCCIIWINSAHNVGMKSVIVQGAIQHYYILALQALLIPNTTANHSITYTNI